MTDIDIRRTININAPIERVWEILSAEFADVGTWTQTVDHSVALGDPDADGAATGRACTVEGFGTTDEQVIERNAATRTLAYSVEAEKIPSFIEGMTNRWTLHRDGADATRAEMRLTAEATGLRGMLVAPMMKRKLGATLDTALADLQVYAATGVPVPAAAS